MAEARRTARKIWLEDRESVEKREDYRQRRSDASRVYRQKKREWHSKLSTEDGTVEQNIATASAHAAKEKGNRRIL